MEESVHCDNAKQIVVLVHGLAANRLVMWRLAGRLKRLGYRVLNYGYWSSFRKIEVHGKTLADRLQTLEEDPRIERIHLVTHSMGCIICRWILSHRRYSKIGRWVMQAPPNRGSHAADSLGRYFHWWFAPMEQLSEARDSFVNQLADFQPLNSVEFGMIEAKYDRVIHPSSLPLQGQTDYSVVPCHHGPMPFNLTVVEQTARFIETGAFTIAAVANPTIATSTSGNE